MSERFWLEENGTIRFFIEFLVRNHCVNLAQVVCVNTATAKCAANISEDEKEEFDAGLSTRTVICEHDEVLLSYAGRRDGLKEKSLWYFESRERRTYSDTAFEVVDYGISVMWWKKKCQCCTCSDSLATAEYIINCEFGDNRSMLTLSLPRSMPPANCVSEFTLPDHIPAVFGCARGQPVVGYFNLNDDGSRPVYCESEPEWPHCNYQAVYFHDYFLTNANQRRFVYNELACTILQRFSLCTITEFSSTQIPF